jgi:hypothetical protein
MPQVAAGEAGGPQRERVAGREERLDTGIGEAHARDAGAGGADDRAGEHGQGGGSGGGVVADAFGAGEAPAGRVAGLRHGGEVRQLFADAEVVGVLVGAGERLRQPGQPLAGEPVDLLIGPVPGSGLRRCDLTRGLPCRCLVPCRSC